jgi:7-alpha-hydroxysteroid dehydrogenase
MTAPRHLERAFQFNVAIAHALTQAAVPHLLDSVKSDDAPGVPNGGSTGGASPQEAAGGGGPVAPRGRVPVRTASVINVSSVIGRVAGRGYLAYGTAKAALAHYTRLAAADLAPRIRVNAIAAGAVATSALDIVMADDTLRGQLEQATPLGRIADPEDIAAAAVFLASPAASYVTGRVLEVDGGIDRPNLDLGLPDL